MYRKSVYLKWSIRVKPIRYLMRGYETDETDLKKRIQDRSNQIVGVAVRGRVSTLFPDFTSFCVPPQ